jgi:hypothetical protein
VTRPDLRSANLRGAKVDGTDLTVPEPRLMLDLRSV